MLSKLTHNKNLLSFFDETGKVSLFVVRFFKEVFKRPFEFRELLRQCFIIGYQSLLLVGITACIMGLVLDLQTRPTMVEFGAESYMAQMIGIAMVREVGPIITALICAGKIGSSIGAELGSMKVAEQIDAMEVSGTNPFRYLVVTRVLAATLMLPVLVIMADTISLLAAWLVEHSEGNVSFTYFFRKIFQNLTFGDLIVSVGKSFFFGFAIGIIGCYKGYTTQKGTAGVGLAANIAVVISSLLLFVIDLIAVLVAEIFYEL